MMSLERLISCFQDVTELPVQIPEVRDAVVGIGIQDQIIFCPDPSLNTAVLRGIFHQFTHRPQMYGDPQRCSLVVYAAALDLPWQRVICCKELVHILDNEVERTSSLDELDGLLTRLLGPLSTEEFDIFDIMATKDRLAMYQALPIMFPFKARDRALERLKSGEMSLEEIAAIAELPFNLVRLILSADWPKLFKDLCC
jgi:hypothetical protein